MTPVEQERHEDHCRGVFTLGKYQNTGNYVHDNGDAGMAFLESFNASVSNNTFENNNYGIRFSVGSADNIFTDNVMLNSSK